MTSKYLLSWLPTERTCDCSVKAQNGLSKRAWLRNQVPIWWFSAKELNTNFDQLSRQHHPAVFPTALAKRVINNYTHENQTVLDIFSGVGTTLNAAQLLKRNAIGFELSKEFTEYTNNRLRLTKNHNNSTPGLTQRTTKNGQHIVQINSDCRDLLKFTQKKSIDLLITSPPYWDMLKQTPSKRNLKNQKYLKNNYSENSLDLSNDSSFEQFFGNIKDIFHKVHQVLKPKGRCVINTGDYRRKGKFIPLSNIYIQTLHELGFELKNKIIWDRRNEYEIGLFSYPYDFIVNNGMFEYILEFKKL